MNTYRDKSIDVLRFVATLLIFNHLAGRFFGCMTFLATGGVLGCALFFFCSGYTLALGRLDRFDFWYRRRLSRLWPTCFMSALLLEVLGVSGGGVLLSLKGCGWFVECILIYYAMYWVLKRLFRLSEFIVLLLSVLVSFIGYFLCYRIDEPGVVIWGDGYFRWVHYFIIFIFGSYVAQRRKSQSSLGKDVVGFFVAVVLFYGYFYVASRSMMFTRLQIVDIVPLMGFVFFAHRIASCNIMQRFMESRMAVNVVRSIGGLSLEMYLIGKTLVAYWPVLPFPIGYVVALAFTLVSAYGVRAVGRAFAQTITPTYYKTGYDWRKIFALLP